MLIVFAVIFDPRILKNPAGKSYSTPALIRLSRPAPGVSVILSFCVILPYFMIQNVQFLELNNINTVIETVSYRIPHKTR